MTATRAGKEHTQAVVVVESRAGRRGGSKRVGAGARKGDKGHKDGVEGKDADNVDVCRCVYVCACIVYGRALGGVVKLG